jgi:hypothetical protein
VRRNHRTDISDRRTMSADGGGLQGPSMSSTCPPTTPTEPPAPGAIRSVLWLANDATRISR